MGLPGAGKTYFAENLKRYLEIWDEPNTVSRFNADDIRRKLNDWDFSIDGRIRQSLRMHEYANSYDGKYVVCDFIAPLPETRRNFNADWTIWIDTIESSRFEDTNMMFDPPDTYDFRITEKNAEKWVPIVGEYIIKNQHYDA